MLFSAGLSLLHYRSSRKHLSFPTFVAQLRNCDLFLMVTVLSRDASAHTIALDNNVSKSKVLLVSHSEGRESGWASLMLPRPSFTSVAQLFSIIWSDSFAWEQIHRRRGTKALHSVQIFVSSADVWSSWDDLHALSLKTIKSFSLSSHITEQNHS